MEKIAIIKLGALGDVVRTLPILLGIKEKYPQSEITWITKENVKSLIESIPEVSKVLTPPDEISQTFDLLYNFDIDDSATSLAQKINAKEKKGFYSQDGFLSAFNPEAEYYINTIFDDELKKSNKKTYQEMMFEVAELPYKQQHYPLKLGNNEVKYAEKFLKENSIPQENLIGVHMGASSRWPSKKWHLDNLKKFIESLSKRKIPVILFGGPNELSELETIYQELKQRGMKIYKQNPNNSLLEFASLINLCSTVVCADSLALHLSLGLSKPTIGLFFVTSPSEVEDYGLLKKIIAPKHTEFFPEKSDQYSEELVKSISPEEVLNAIDDFGNNK